MSGLYVKREYLSHLRFEDNVILIPETVEDLEDMCGNLKWGELERRFNNVVSEISEFSA